MNQHLWIKGTYSNPRQGMKMSLRQEEFFFTFAGWKTESAVQMICMVMVLSRQKGRISLGGSITLQIFLLEIWV